MRTHIFAAVVVLALGTFGASGASAGIINGDFATGDFTGWTKSAVDDAFNPIDPDPFIFLSTLGSDNVAMFETGEFADVLFVATLQQSFMIDAAEPNLVFLFTLPNAVPDPTGTGTSPFLDSVLVSVDDGFSTFKLLQLDMNGPLADPFGTAPGSVALGPPSDVDFDFGFGADLSSLVGTNVTLFFDLIQEDDGFQLAGPAVG